MHKKYIIHGDLTHLAKVFGDRQRVWDMISEFRTRISIDLTNQHDASLFSGPIGMIGTFYLVYPKDIPRQKRTNEAIHTRKPTMSSLIYFLEHIGFGILFSSSTSIASVEVQKLFTKENPRVELEIFSLNK